MEKERILIATMLCTANNDDNLVRLNTTIFDPTIDKCPLDDAQILRAFQAFEYLANSGIDRQDITLIIHSYKTNG